VLELLKPLQFEVVFFRGESILQQLFNELHVTIALLDCKLSHQVQVTSPFSIHTFLVHLTGDFRHGIYIFELIEVTVQTLFGQIVQVVFVFEVDIVAIID